MVQVQVEDAAEVKRDRAILAVAFGVIAMVILAVGLAMLR